MKLAIALALGVLLPAMGAQAETLNAAIRQTNSRWESAVNSSNPQALASVYTADAVVVPPSLEIVSKPDQIRKYWLHRMRSGTHNFQMQTVALHSSGNVIYQTAVWNADVTSNGRTADFDGVMTNMLVRQADGSYKIRMQSWN